jgi:hypothetical protein
MQWRRLCSSFRSFGGLAGWLFHGVFRARVTTRIRSRGHALGFCELE